MSQVINVLSLCLCGYLLGMATSMAGVPIWIGLLGGAALGYFWPRNP